MTNANTTAIEYRGYRIEVSHVGKGWRASIFSHGSGCGVSQYEGAMAESTDQRIQKILRNKAKEKEADDLEKKLAKDRSDERQATADRVRQKWKADTYLSLIHI